MTSLRPWLRSALRTAPRRLKVAGLAILGLDALFWLVGGAAAGAVPGPEIAAPRPPPRSRRKRSPAVALACLIAVGFGLSFRGGGGRQALPAGQEPRWADSDPAWSPDQHHVAFARGGD